MTSSSLAACGLSLLAAVTLGQLREDAAGDEPHDVHGWSLLARSRCNDALESASKGSDGMARAEELMGQAEDAARKAIDLDAQSAEAWTTLGHVLCRAGKFDEAGASLYHAEKLAPATAELLCDLADALLAARQFAIENDDQPGASGKLTEAVAALERARPLFTNAIDVERRLADLNVMKGEPQAALKNYRRALALAPKETALHEAHLALIESTQSFADAISFYTGLVDEPALAHWYRSRVHELDANVLLNKKKDYVAAANAYLEAEKDFRAAAVADASLRQQVDAYVPSLRAWRGRAWMLAEKFAESEAALLSALDLAPDHKDALATLHELQDAMWKKYGGEAMPKDKLDEMRGFASKLCTIEPTNPANWNNWGLFARDSGKYEESYLAYRRALALAPKDPRYLNDTALVLMYHLGRDLDRAEQWLVEAVALADRGANDNNRATSERLDDQSTLGDAYGNLINLVQNRGDKERAIALLREFTVKLPKRSEVDYWKKQLLPDEWKEEQDKKAADAEAAKKAADEKKGAEPPKSKDAADGKKKDDGEISDAELDEMIQEDGKKKEGGGAR